MATIKLTRRVPAVSRQVPAFKVTAFTQPLKGSNWLKIQHDSGGSRAEKWVEETAETKQLSLLLFPLALPAMLAHRVTRATLKHFSFPFHPLIPPSVPTPIRLLAF